MKAAIEENHQIMNAMFDKIKENSEEIKKMSNIKEIFNKNKAKIIIIIFESIVWSVREVGYFIVTNYGGGFYGDLIVKLTGIAQICVTMVGAYIFGNKTELDDKVGLIQSLELKNQMQHFIIDNKHLDDPGWEDPNKIKVSPP